MGKVTHPLTPSVCDTAVLYIGDYFIGIFTASISTGWIKLFVARSWKRLFLAHLTKIFAT
jgi:hypothetical protein